VRISRIKLDHFRRFTDLEIKNIADTVRLVVMAGPNGCGKSSLLDALSVRHQLSSGLGWAGDNGYYSKPTDLIREVHDRIKVDVYGGKELRRKDAFYFRSAYRNDPEFTLAQLNRLGPVADRVRFRRMIESDVAVTENYQRLASQGLEELFAKPDPTITIGAFRESVLSPIREPLKRLFPDLTLNSLGSPLERGTFRFDKGTSKGFDYKNLSGGEKAAFDLVLDIAVNRHAYQDSVYCIDEPDAHMNTRLQGALLEELFNLIPEPSQLWVATHSIGMMRKARELNDRFPGTVAFLDFGGHDFDQPTILLPSKPTRAFWENVLNVALDDLASLVAPREVVVCEGNPAGALPGKNAEHDATIYNTVFSDEMADVKFLAGGNAKDVAADRLGFVTALPMIASGIKVRRLIDRDDHAQADIDKMAREDITTLGRRHLEAYIYADEVLTALCQSQGKPAEAPNLIAEKQNAIAASVLRGNPRDDVKSAAGEIYTKAKARLGLVGVGNDERAFARNTLAPLVKPGMAVYAELKRDIFGI
jgi:predicted ATPase